MKTKNVFLAVVAFTFAIGSAFASMFIIEPVFIKAVLNEQAGWECYDTQVTCNAQGTQVCQVTIPLRGGGSIVASSTPATGQAFVYRSGCEQVLNSINFENKGTAPLDTDPEKPISVRLD